MDGKGVIVKRMAVSDVEPDAVIAVASPDASIAQLEPTAHLAVGNEAFTTEINLAVLADSSPFGLEALLNGKSLYEPTQV